MLLFPLAAMFKSSSVFAADPPKEEYDAAMAAISDGSYYLTTDVNGTTFYVTQNGNLTNDKEKAYLFAISKVNASSAVQKLFDTAFLIDPENGAHFSNATPLLDGNAYLHLGFFYQDSGNNRNDWERQVLYLKDGKFAIRTSNTPYGETSWLDAGRVFWSWETGETEGSIIPCYSYEPAYIWTLELSSSPISFEDANVKAICVANWDTNGDGELSYAEAAAVTYMGDVFRNNTSIVSFNELQYFSGLTLLDFYAFEGCSGLASIIIPNSVTNIGFDAFTGTAWYDNQPDGLVYAGKVAYKYKGTMPENTTIVIEEGTLGIAYNSFNNCHGLTSITIPNSVVSIGACAFLGCKNLESITIPNSVVCIDFDAFYACGGLESIVVEDGNSVYDSRNNCNALIETATNTLLKGCNNTIIPKGITSIFESAFTICGGLKNIVIPESVTTIGNNAFWGCGGLESIVVEEGNAVYDSRNNCNALIETASNTLIKGCNNTIIPEDVAIIDNFAFLNCGGLTSIKIPESITEIGHDTFFNCDGLTSIVIPNSVTTIGDSTFKGCI